MLNIVVIGDSIARGVGSSNEDTNSFGALLGEKLGGQVTNLGITGLDSGQLLEKLQTESFKEALAHADIVCVSIGSNDLLKPFLSIVAESVGVTGESKELYLKMQKQFAQLSKNDPLQAGNALAEAVTKIRTSRKLEDACKAFPDHFSHIIAALKEQNPDALVYVNNIYNPYYGVVYQYKGLTLLNVQDLCEGYIQELNRTFDEQSEDYKVMDMYSIFRREGYTNVNAASLEDMSRVSFDPHPNDEGYRMMADYMYTQMDSRPPKVELVLEEGKESAGVAVRMDAITLRFSEPVRLISGKKLLLTDTEQMFEYTCSGTEALEEGEDFLLVLPMNAFVSEGQKRASDGLSYGTAYELFMEEGAIKDRGNLQPQDLLLARFETEAMPETEIEAHSVAVVNVVREEEKPAADAHRIMLVSAGMFLMVAILIAVLYNHMRKKR